MDSAMQEQSNGATDGQTLPLLRPLKTSKKQVKTLWVWRYMRELGKTHDAKTHNCLVCLEQHKKVA